MLESNKLTSGDGSIDSDGLVETEMKGVISNDIVVLVDTEGEKEIVAIGVTETE